MTTRPKIIPDPSERSNEDWIRDLTCHDSPQQRRVFEELSHLLFRVARRFLAPAGMQELAEECVQEALVIVLRDLERFHGESRFTTWAIGILLNKCREEIRKHKREGLTTDFTPTHHGGELPLLEAVEDPEAHDPELSTARRELIATVDEIIRQTLTPRQRTVLVNITLLDQSVEDVAQQLGTSRNNVYKILHDARKKLKKELESRGYAWEDVCHLLE